MNLSIIAAMSENRVIGINNQLPWHLSEDLKRFKKLTMGKPIIMGRKTYESIGRPLPGRRNIILSRNPEIHFKGTETAKDLDSALALTSDEEAFVIGGEKVFQEAFPKADTLYLTLIHKDFEGDAFFPEFDLKNFMVVEETKQTKDDEFSYTFITAKRS